MTQSMTAFARRSTPEITWEIYSLNHRYLDVSFKLPELFRGLEPQLRESMGRYIRRGKIECQLKYKGFAQTNSPVNFNTTLLNELASAKKTLHDAFDQAINVSLTELLAWPGLLQTDATDHLPQQEQALNLFEDTLQDLCAARQREGLALQNYLTTHLQQLRNEATVVQQHLPNVLNNQREKILTRAQELQVSIEPTRLEQELLFLIQKMDISEELGRLQIHAAEVEKALANNGSIGRRLDFLMQELHREANTLGAKSSDTKITHAAVNLKVLIEQMREQVQNIE